MAFDGYRTYQEDQRRAKRWQAILPCIIAAVILIILAVGFHAAYVRSHAKPKPTATHAFDVQSGWEQGHSDEGQTPIGINGEPCSAASDECGNPGTVWISCNAGLQVTDMHDCPEYKARQELIDMGCVPDKVCYGWLPKPKAKHKKAAKMGLFYRGWSKGYWPTIADYNPHAHITMGELMRNEALGQPCIFAINGDCWITLDPEMTHVSRGDGTEVWTPGYSIAESMRVANADGSKVEFDRPEKDVEFYTLASNGYECPAEFASVGDGSTGVTVTGITIRCTPKPKPVLHVHVNTQDSPDFGHDSGVITAGPLAGLVVGTTTGTSVITDPQFICTTSGACFPKCDNPLTPAIPSACYQTTFGGTNELILPADYVSGFVCPDEFARCWVRGMSIEVMHGHRVRIDASGDRTVIPDDPKPCQMPTDVDVCPVMQLDPKKSHD